MAGENDKWEIYADKRGEFRWRRTATNGNIVGSSCEGYAQKSACTSNARRHGMDGNPDDLGAKDKWEVYKDKRSEFRWRRTATNGEITGASSESYKAKADAEANAKRNGM
ncbi:MAG: YegP family protein [Alphaproteobacteria bacterium]